MKKSVLFILFAFITGIASSQTIVSGAYHWKDNGTILDGSGAVLSRHHILGHTLQANLVQKYLADKSGPERFFIIKTGPIEVQLNNKQTTLNRGSVICVLPGDSVIFKNAGSSSVSWYEMAWLRDKGPDMMQAGKGEPSFLINWQDMVEKPTQKGSTRQLFSRPTAMLQRFDIHVTQLNQGLKSHDPHTHQDEEIILMLDGHAEMQIGQEHQKANAGDLVYLGSMVLHNLTNTGSSPCLYFAIQWH